MAAAADDDDDDDVDMDVVVLSWLVVLVDADSVVVATLTRAVIRNASFMFIVIGEVVVAVVNDTRNLKLEV